MKRNQVLPLVLGLIAGFVLGAVLIGTSDDLRTNLFGTAGEPENESDVEARVEERDYYLTNIDDAEEWLVSLDPEASNQLTSAFAVVDGISSANDLASYFAIEADGSSSVRDSIQTVLADVYEGIKQEEEAPEGEIVVCLGLDNDPYSLTGPGLYVYVQIPENLSENVPSDWQQLDGPKEDNMLWSTECYEPSEG